MRAQKISRSHLSPRTRGGQTGEMIRPERFRRTDHCAYRHYFEGLGIN
jgi:hypothetical protein